MTEKKIFIILPAYNEDKHIGDLIAEIKSLGYENIIVINDGSTDLTKLVAENSGATVITHPINLGAGAATQTGLTYAKRKKADITITLDSDGQHNPKDIEKLIKEIEEKKVDIVIGSRFKGKNDIPIVRRFFNLIANLMTFALSSTWVSDTQSGFKAFNQKALEKIDIKSTGFEFCSEIILQIKPNSLKFSEIPIDVRYSKESQMKGQSLANGMITAFKLFIQAITR